MNLKPHKYPFGVREILLEIDGAPLRMFRGQKIGTATLLRAFI